MLYKFLYPLAPDIFNVLRYVTFRSVWALVFSLVISVVLGPIFIRWLTRLKCGQHILEDVSAHKNKAGTPTMGGILIIFSALISALMWSDLDNRYVWLTLFAFVGFGLIGFWDDYTKLKGGKNKGITARQKFWAQVLLSFTVIMLLLYLPTYFVQIPVPVLKPGTLELGMQYVSVKVPAYNTQLSVPILKDLVLNLGWAYVPFAILVMVGSSNGVNLTDGLDGLAITPVAVAGIILAIFLYLTGTASFARHLYLPHLPGIGEVTVFAAAFVGACIGFLWFNAYPAQVFMGDVGSLSLGGTLGFLAVLCKQELLLLVIGGLFVIETLSVVLQVGYFRFTKGKRILRMAPLHHHFELKGVPESKIIIRFWIISALCGMIALSLLKIR